MKLLKKIATIFFLSYGHILVAQPGGLPKGKLFIIGGGARTPALLQSLLTTAAMDKKDYVVVLPMSSTAPDTGYYNFKTDLEPFCKNAIVNFNFTWDKVNYNAVIDQHFVARSRYNRLLSAIAKYPLLTCIGIDEATAIIIYQNKVKVSGQSQVIVMRKPEGLTFTKEKLIKLKDLQFSIYTDGDEFTLNNIQ